MMVEVKILGLSKVSEKRRIFIPRSVRELLKTDKISFVVEKGVKLVPSPDGVQIDQKSRVYLSEVAYEKLGVKKGDSIIFLQKDGDISVLRLDEVRVSV
ncbi:MAG: hypothetical protein JRD89_04765 [Deltaproteobacteria bacterium]|nr:hypothetical protein [Deltaproteobacteria bacterium]